MKKEQILDLMNSIPADLVEEIDISPAAGRRLPGAVRTGLVAACLCLAVLGTAVAAAPEAITALIERLTVSTIAGGEEPGYAVQGEMIQYPLSTFSPTLLAASEGRENPAAPVSLTFDTWDEVQAFLGGDVPCVWPGGGAGWETDWFQVVLFHTELEVLWGIQIFSVDLGRQAEVCVNICTEHWQQRNDNIASTWSVPGTGVENMGSYPMAGGPVAEIVAETDVPGPEGNAGYRVHGIFMNAGILYQVESIGSVSTREETVSRLHAILDSFR